MSQRLIDKQAMKQKKNGKESPTQQNTKLTGGRLVSNGGGVGTGWERGGSRDGHTLSR